MKRIFIQFGTVLTIGLLAVYACKPNVTNPGPNPDDKKEEEPYRRDAKWPDPEKDANWTKQKVDKGIYYWFYYGNDPASSGDHQCVHIADINLADGYKLNIAFDGSQITSNIFKKYNAYVAMNGAYEQKSIFVKTAKFPDPRAYIENDTISSDDGAYQVPNWKNLGGLAIEADGTSYIFNSYCGDKPPYGARLKQQRDLYDKVLSDIPNLMSSSPLLIDEYEPLGLTFVPSDIPQAPTKYPYEHPYHHQGVRHPRTAIAFTSDNHILMIVADGRRSGKASGFTAKELTQFLINNFDPVSALNLDGGGSSTLCVREYGDKNTHVVNYPCDDGQWDHDGERSVTSHLYITNVFDK